MLKGFVDENKNYKNLINGEWKDSSREDRLEILSPVDDSLVGRVPAMTRLEAEQAILAARKSCSSWANTPVFQRAELFYKAAERLEVHQDEIAEILVMEIAKDKKSACSEISRTADFLRYTADMGKSMEGIAVAGDHFPGGARNKLSYVTRVPLGVVLAISPFNYPVNLSLSKIAPALIGGNTVVLKPPSQGAISALYLAAVFQEAGIPKGVLNTVTGRGGEIGDFLATHPEIDFINFTGSTQVGKHLAETAGMVPLMLELGGKDAAIVLEDADLDATAENVVTGGYSYSGQRCTAVKRILAVDSIADELVEKMVRRIKQLKTGDPREEGVSVVPLINDKAVTYVQELIQDALGKGARLATGNRTRGRLMEPTLLDHVNTEMRIAWEEPFGPVLPVLRMKNAEEAVDIANRSEYGLQSSVFTKDIDRAFAVANRLEVGTVQINGKPERGPDHFPFLGVKSSGMGTQGVRYSIEAMTRPKAVVVNLGEV